jgi:apolipoprotein N-acyltransferase
VISGVLYFTGFAGFDQWYLMAFSLVPLLVAVDGMSPRRAFLLGWLMGTVTNLGGYYWVVGMLERFSGFPLPLCILFTVLLCAYQGGTFAVFTLGVALIRRRGWDPFVSGAAVLVAVERLYPLLFPSFMANGLYVQPVLVQTAELFGVTFVTFLVAMLNFSLFHLWRLVRQGRIALRPTPLVATGVLWVASLVFGFVRMSTVDAKVDASEKMRVGVVQVNMGIFDKREDPREGLRRHREDSLGLEREENPELLVWPESSIVYTIPSEAENLKRRTIGNVSTPTVFGAVRSELAPDRERIFNTAFIVDGDGRKMGYYDKVYRLAFGEYLPLGDTFPILYEWSPNSGRFDRGTVRTPLPFGEHRLGTLICYEDILPRYVNSLMNAVDPPPDILVNITNDAWFGRTTEPQIHLALATFRSVEQRRWLIRATNSGISAFVDPNGRITKTTPLMERASIVEDVTFSTTRTIYSRGGWLFDWAAIVLAVGLMVFRPPGKKKKRKRKKKR